MSSALLFAPLGARALELGSLSVESTLGQRLLAELEIVPTNEQSLREVRVGLADAATYEKFGVSRPDLSAEIDVALAESASGKPVVRISSREPVQELFLNLLLSVEERDVRLVREVAILLDPSVMHDLPATGDDPVAIGTDGAPARTHVVRSGDSLMRIAERYTPASASPEQTALALYEGNPKAFLGSIHRLIAGARLTLPSEAAIRARSARDARARIREGIAAFKRRQDDAGAQARGRPVREGRASGEDGPADDAPRGVGLVIAPLEDDVALQDFQAVVVNLQGNLHDLQGTLEERIGQLETLHAQVDELIEERETIRKNAEREAAKAERDAAEAERDAAKALEVRDAELAAALARAEAAENALVLATRLAAETVRDEADATTSTATLEPVELAVIDERAAEPSPLEIEEPSDEISRNGEVEAVAIDAPVDERFELERIDEREMLAELVERSLAPAAGDGPRPLGAADPLGTIDASPAPGPSDTATTGVDTRDADVSDDARIGADASRDAVRRDGGTDERVEPDQGADAAPGDEIAAGSGATRGGESAGTSPLSRAIELARGTDWSLSTIMQLLRDGGLIVLALCMVHVLFSRRFRKADRVTDLELRATRDDDPDASIDFVLRHSTDDREKEELLKSVLADSPRRQDIRLQLLELYAAAGSVNLFGDEARLMYRMTRGNTPEWYRVVELGLKLDADIDFYKFMNEDDLFDDEMDLGLSDEDRISSVPAGTHVGGRHGASESIVSFEELMQLHNTVKESEDGDQFTGPTGADEPEDDGLLEFDAQWTDTSSAGRDDGTDAPAPTAAPVPLAQRPVYVPEDDTELLAITVNYTYGVEKLDVDLGDGPDEMLDASEAVGESDVLGANEAAGAVETSGADEPIDASRALDASDFLEANETAGASGPADPAGSADTPGSTDAEASPEPTEDEEAPFVIHSEADFFGDAALVDIDSGTDTDGLSSGTTPELLDLEHAAPTVADDTADATPADFLAEFVDAEPSSVVGATDGEDDGEATDTASDVGTAGAFGDAVDPITGDGGDDPFVDLEFQATGVDLKLNLAESYIDGGHLDEARRTIEEVLPRADAGQKRRADEMLERIDGSHDAGTAAA